MTVPVDESLTLADRMRRHAGDADHLYAQLMRAMATDWEDGGPVREICAGWEDAATGSVIQLRLLAALFRIVLTGRAGELEEFYPSLGGTSDPSEAWPYVRNVLGENVEELQDALTVAPQTNEVGRSNALLVGIFAAIARTGCSRVRLLEPGASAGLNLLVDRFRFVNEGWAFGPAESPVLLGDGVRGAVEPLPFEIVQRRGCDPSPVDISTAEGRIRLRSFVWPFHVERHALLTAALQVAQAFPPVVDRAAAGEWLEEVLARPVEEGVLTVVWQSITRQYWSADERERVDEAVREAASRTTLAHVTMEYAGLGLDNPPELRLSWSVGAAGPALRTERLGTVGDHGFPVRVGA